MTDKPRKTLSLKQQSDTIRKLPTVDSAQSPTRSRRRIIRRENLPATKLSSTKKPPTPKPKKKPSSPVPKKPVVSPSDLRLRSLDKQLQEYSEVWRNYQPLMIGVEKEIFRHIAKHHLSCSKRVVQRLLRQHTQDERYQSQLRAGRGRYHLDGTKV